MKNASLPTPSAAISHRTLARGAALFRQGDPTFAIFRVRRGQVRLVRHLADGSTVLLHLAHDGEIFSEAALFSPEYHCDAIADADCEIEVHPKDALSTAFNEHPAAAWTYMAHLAQQVIALRSRLELRNIRSAEERVLQFLRIQANSPDRTVRFVRSLKDIAAEIGLTHESFYRTLSKLEAAGAIARDRRNITLLN